MCCKYCTESLCLYIQKKIFIIKRLNTLVIMLNINEHDNMEKLYGILTDFIRKLENLLFTMIGEKESSNLPFNNIFSLETMKNWNFYMDSCILSWINTHHILIHYLTFSILILTKTCDILIDIQIILEINNEIIRTKNLGIFSFIFPKSQLIIPCTRTIICNYFNQNVISYYILDYGEKCLRKSRHWVFKFF